MNGKGSQAWEPRFRYEVLNFHGQSVAMNLINGGGKTTLAEALLAILSRDVKLVTNTKGKFSPPTNKVWSHIQVELIMPQGSASQEDMLTNIGGDVSGETWVFGMCGHRGPQESIAYYYYPGTLNDLSIGKKENNKIILTSNKQFKDSRQAIKGFRWGVDKTEWVEVIGRHLSLDGIRQLVTFQKKGGSDKSAQLFNFKRRSGESYDAAFFYEVLAPAIMSDLMYKEGEEGEHQLEDTIYETVMRVVRAKRKTEAKREEVKQQEVSAGRLDNVAETAERAVEKNNEYQHNLNQMALDVHVLTDLTKNALLPGVPKSSLPEGITGDVAKYIVIEPGKDEIRITDRGLSVLMGMEPKHINELAGRNSIGGRKITQVIDIPCDLENKAQRLGGHTSTSYSLGQAKKILQAASKYAQNLTESTAIEILEDAETWFERVADTNLYRGKLIEAKADYEHSTTVSHKAQEFLNKLQEDKNTLIAQQREIKDNEAIYNDLCQSGIFSEKELAEPLKTGESVTKEYREADKSLSDFNITAAQLGALKDDWGSFVELHGESTPHDIEKQYLAKKDELNKALSNVNKEVSSLNQELEGVTAEIKDVDKKIVQIDAKLTQFNELKPSVDTFKQRFGDTDPDGLDRKLINQHAKLSSHIEDLKSQKEEHEDAIKSIDKFYEIAGIDADPTDWLEKVNGERERLITDRQSKEQRFSVLKRQRETLEKEKVAASEILQKAIDVLADNSLIHISVHKFILEQNISVERKNTLLASFSALLFAPVFENKESALKSVELLHELELPVPVFVTDTLELYCREGVIDDAISGKLFIGIHAGVVTRQVECLLDPSLVEREKQSLDVQIKNLDNELSIIKERLDEISPEGDLVLLARKAKNGVDTNAHAMLEEIIETIESVNVEINELLPLIADDLIEVIKAMQIFKKIGGYLSWSDLRETLESLTDSENEYSERETKIKASITDNMTKTQELRTDIDNVYPANIQKIISQAIQFWNKDGPEFINSEGEKRLFLESAQQTAKERNSYERLFIRAQHYLDAMALQDSGESIDKRISKLDNDINEKRTECDEATKQAGDLQNTIIPNLKEVVSAIDSAVCIVLGKYKKVAQLSKDVNTIKVSGDDLEQHAVWGSADTLREAVTHSEDYSSLVNYAQALTDSVSELNIEELMGTVKRAQRDAEDSERNFIEAAHKTAESGDGLAPSEKERLKSVKSITDASRIKAFYKEFIAILHKGQDELAELDRGEQGTRKDVADHTAFMINQAAHSLETLKKVVKHDHSNYKSHFVVEADTVDRKDAAALIERIVLLLDTQEKHRQEDKEKGTLIESDKMYKDNLRTKIRDQVYRSIFSKPSVKYVNERIRQKGEHDFDEDLSEGEKTALSLMWTIRLAEFAIERETRKLRTSTARQKARSRAENILIIDGLFSNLSEPALIKSVMAGIEDTRGRFQLIGLIHHPHYENDFNVFPVLLLGKKHVAPGGGTGWVSFSNGKAVMPEIKGNKEGSVGFAELTRIPAQKDNIHDYTTKPH